MILGHSFQDDVIWLALTLCWQFDKYEPIHLSKQLCMPYTFMQFVNLMCSVTFVLPAHRGLQIYNNDFGSIWAVGLPVCPPEGLPSLACTRAPVRSSS